AQAEQQELSVVSTAKRKAFAYITHGDRLLVFSHPLAPDAGIQVPAGTMRDGEQPEDAVLREAAEETGLTDLVLVRYLGEQRYDMTDFGWDEVHHRHFYHLRCTGEPPDVWRNYEPDPADGGELPLFELFWAQLPDGVPELIADHGALLPPLIHHLGADGLLCSDVLSPET
ncbi:MAG: NUDIX hydrolase, partial [Dehalococcoidia bacterium]